MTAHVLSAPIAPSFSQVRWAPGCGGEEETSRFAMDDDAAPVRTVLLVCTGNICRSPYAELLLRARAPELTVSSAGVFATVGWGMDALMAAELADRSVPSGGFRATQLSAEDVEADLILVMSENHRRFIRDEFPGALHRTGLLGHVGSLTGLDRASVREWARTRRSDDGRVPDPYRKGPAAAAQTARLLDSHLERLLSLRTRSIDEGSAQ